MGDLPADFLRWAIGDLFGITLVTPVILVWMKALFQKNPAPQPCKKSYAGATERHIWMSLTLFSTVLTLWQLITQPQQALAILGLPLAVLIWGAVRLPPRLLITTNTLIFLLLAFTISLGFAGPTPQAPMDIASLAAALCVISILPVTLAMGAHQSRIGAARLLHRATTDSLTGLLNRDAFEHQVRLLVQEKTNTPMALAYIDIDRFRLINDAMLHATGDELIGAIAGVIRANTPSHDLVARTGGDEFAILMQDVSQDTALARAEALCKAVSDYRFRIGDMVAAPSISVGLVIVNDAISEFGALLSLADTACFTAKERGGNRVQLAEPGKWDIVQKSSDTMRWALRLNTALEHDYFELFCQAITPLHAAPTEQLHFEILVRLQEPGKPLVLPGQFIDAAERYAVGVKLDRHVLHKTLDWFDEHPEQVRRVGLCSINLSADSLQDETFHHDLLQRLSHSALRPEQLCFELTETSALSDLARAQRFIATVRAAGCHFALDDFGTGFCSFSYLRSLDVDFFKIDGSFVREVDQSPLSYAIVNAIADIGRVMNKKTIAEGVETSDIARQLRLLGVDYAQGHHMGMPMAIADFFTTKNQ